MKYALHWLTLIRNAIKQGVFWGMTIAPDVEARQLAASLQKKLFHLNSSLRDALESEEDLKKIFDDVEKLKALAEGNAQVQAFPRQKLSVDQVLSLFKDAKQKYYASKLLLEKYQDLLESSDAALERFRTYRFYEFKDDDSFVKFLKNACKSKEITELWAKPELIGSINLNKVAEELHLPQQGRLYCGVPIETANKFFDKVLAQNPSSGMYLESYPVTFLWRPNNTVKVDAETSHIRELDELAKNHNAQVLDK